MMGRRASGSDWGLREVTASGHARSLRGRLLGLLLAPPVNITVPAPIA